MESIRKYRIKLDYIINDNAEGSIIFYMLIAYLIMYILQNWVTKTLNINISTYYLSLTPISILINLIMQNKSYLNTQLFNNNINIYKIMVLMNMYLLFQSLEI